MLQHVLLRPRTFCMFCLRFGVLSCFLLSVFCVHQLELDGKVGCVHMLLSPDQITHVTDLLAALCIDTGIQNTINKLISGLFISMPDAILVCLCYPKHST